MNDFQEWITPSIGKAGQCLDYRMHVIGHNDPRQKPIPLTVKMQQCILDHLPDAGVFQPAGAVSLIGETLDSAAKARTAGIIGRFATTELQFGFPGGDHRGGNRVDKAESEKLHRSRFIEVWEVATIVPSFVRAGRPRSRVVFVRARRPRSRGVFLHEP